MTAEALVPPSLPFDAQMPAAQVRERYAAMLREWADDAEPDELRLMREQFDMLTTAAELMEGRTPRQVRERARLLFRCDDCGGRAVAWVVVTQGRPLFIGEAGKGRAVVLALDVSGWAAPTFRCRKRAHRLTSEQVAQVSRHAGGPAEIRLTHTDMP